MSTVNFIGQIGLSSKELLLLERAARLPLPIIPPCVNTPVLAAHSLKDINYEEKLLAEINRKIFKPIS